MIVVDASAVLEILSRSEAGLQLENAILRLDLHAPHLLDLEILNAVRRWERSGAIHPAEAQQILSIFGAMRITRHGHGPLLDHVWKLRHNLTAYDAAYLALAAALNATLVTMDSGLRKMSQKSR